MRRGPLDERRDHPKLTFCEISAKLEVYEAGSLVLSYLAYPDLSKAQGLRDDLFDTLCKVALLARADAEPNWASTRQWLTPRHLLVDTKTVTRSLRLARNRWRQRMAAARMARAFIGPAMGQPVRLPPGMTKPTLTQLAELVLSDTGESEPENVQRRVWRPSLPVIHLAAALDRVLEVLDRAHNHPTDFTALLSNAGLIKTIVRVAEAFEPVVLGDSRFRMAPERLLRFRLAEPVKN